MARFPNSYAPRCSLDQSGCIPTSWWRRGNREREAVISLAPSLDKLERLRLALLMDACLAVASGTTEDFFEIALPSEQDFWAPLTAELNQVENRSRKERPKKQIEAIVPGLLPTPTYFTVWSPARIQYRASSQVFNSD